MAVTSVSSGTPTTGTTSVALNYPASIVAGNMLVIFICNKYPNNGPTVPSGWTAPANNQWSGGAGAAGVDTGTVYATMFYKIAVGGETGTLTVTVTSGDCCSGVMYQATKVAGKIWDTPLCTGGACNTTATNPMSVTGAANLSLDAGDLVYAGFAMNGDVYFPVTATAATATGSTFGTQGLNSGSTASGQDCGFGFRRLEVSTGPSTAAPVGTCTVTTTTAAGPSGAGVFIRLRELPAKLGLLGVG